MIIRIVKMTFQPEETANFLAFFEPFKEQIRHFEGCQKLQILRGKDQPNIIFSYSYWDGPAALDCYRKSALFGQVWPETKKRFAAKPEAWTLDLLAEID